MMYRYLSVNTTLQFLFTVFKNKSEIEKLLKLFSGLSFLKPEKINNCFYEDLMVIKPNDHWIDNFFNCIEKNYISLESNFQLSIWGEFSNSLMRTINACESFHSKLNRMFYLSYPNTFQFIEALKNAQTNIYIKIWSSNLTNNEERK